MNEDLPVVQHLSGPFPLSQLKERVDGYTHPFATASLSAGISWSHVKVSQKPISHSRRPAGTRSANFSAPHISEPQMGVDSNLCSLSILT